MRKAFTLLEILVVVAIIGLLAAILFPAFARTRDNARRASCQSNLKQIGLGLIQYTQDYDETMPSYEDTAPTAQNYALVRLYPYTKSDQILTCPSDPTPATGPGAFEVAGLSGAGLVRCSYTLTLNDAYEFPGLPIPFWGVLDSFKTVPLASIPLPSETIAASERVGTSDPVFPLSDAYLQRGSGTADPTNPGGSYDATLGTTQRHLEGANYLFADGHVKRMKHTCDIADQTGANATLNGVKYFYFWRQGVAGK